MQQSGYTHTQKQLLTFAIITALGIAALLIGIVLILFAHYHERAYVFLGLGAGGFIGGIAGIVGGGSRSRAALSYGTIASGMMGTVIGINYLNAYYSLPPNQMHGFMAIALSLVAILAGFVGTLFAQPKGGIVAFLSVIMLGVIASLGIVAVTVGTICLASASVAGPCLSSPWRGGSMPYCRYCLWYIRSEQGEGQVAVG